MENGRSRRPSWYVMVEVARIEPARLSLSAPATRMIDARPYLSRYLSRGAAERRRPGVRLAKL
jgi:hypothetical protein